MNCLEKKASEKFEQEALSFYIALANAFRPEETPGGSSADSSSTRRRLCRNGLRDADGNASLV